LSVASPYPPKSSPPISGHPDHCSNFGKAISPRKTAGSSYIASEKLHTRYSSLSIRCRLLLLVNEGAICLLDALDFDKLDRVPGVLARDPITRMLKGRFIRKLQLQGSQQSGHRPLS
jgi:hypothetical protein